MSYRLIMYPGPIHKVYMTEKALIAGYRKHCGYDRGRVIGRGVILEQSCGGIFKPMDREDGESLHKAAFPGTTSIPIRSRSDLEHIKL